MTLACFGKHYAGRRETATHVYKEDETVLIPSGKSSAESVPRMHQHTTAEAASKDEATKLLAWGQAHG